MHGRPRESLIGMDAYGGQVDVDYVNSPPVFQPQAWAILLIDIHNRQAASAGLITGCCISPRRYNAPMKTHQTPDLRVAAMLLIAALGICLAMPRAVAKTSHELEEIRIGALPAEAREALARIAAGKPLPYERDGVVFGNREHLLPAKPRGYYHEYTVKTPGERTRGARRIVCGGAIAATSECYYSDDHYRSFKKIRQ